MREQREFLPVFAVREELLKVVRDNQGKVINVAVDNPSTQGFSSKLLSSLVRLDLVKPRS